MLNGIKPRIFFAYWYQSVLVLNKSVLVLFFLSPSSLQKDGIDRAYFAVFDGHGGVDAANYSATHLHVNVGLHEEIVKNPAEALKCSFQKTDEMFLFKAKREVSG